jgi:hypothetical protein
MPLPSSTPYTVCTTGLLHSVWDQTPILQITQPTQDKIQEGSGPQKNKQLPQRTFQG